MINSKSKNAIACNKKAFLKQPTPPTAQLFGRLLSVLKHPLVFGY